MDADSTQEEDWKQYKETLMEERRPFVIVEGGIWNVPRKFQTPELFKKMDHIGGECRGIFVGGRKIWTNRKHVEEKITQELYVNKAKDDFSLGWPRAGHDCGKMLGTAMEEALRRL